MGKVCKMKMVMRVVCGCGLVVALVLFSGNAWAYFEDSLVDSFESPTYSNGALDGQTVWTTNDSAINIVGASAPGHGSQAIEFSTAVVTGAYAENSSLNISLDSAGDYVTFHVNPTFTQTSSSFEVHFMAGQSMEAGVMFGYNGNNYDILVYNDTGWTDTNINAPGRWAEYSIQYQSPSAYSLYRDGSLVMDNITPGGGTFSTIDTMRLEAPNGFSGGTGNAQFDAVYVNPEPATVFMMLMGLGLFYRERHRLFSV